MITGALIIMIAFVWYAINEGGATVLELNKCAVGIIVVHPFAVTVAAAVFSNQYLRKLNRYNM